MDKNKNLRFAIDLLWVRPNMIGGTEFYIRNILDGFQQLDDDFEVVLILSKDNEESFTKYFSDKRFIKHVCNMDNKIVYKRILWQNIHLNSLCKKENIGICFEPVYSKPIITSKKIKFITTIHDLQALHYPKYQSNLKVLWLKFCWYISIKTSYNTIAISNFVQNDIIKRYKVDPKKVLVFYNAIKVDKFDILPFDVMAKKYNIEENNFYYTVASLAPHKNLITIIKVMSKINQENINLPKILLVSGISGNIKDEICKLIQKYDLQNNVILTSFIENNERNTLYKNCRAFLFPSIFEGFGMPPIEAMVFGTNVITTKKTSIYEVTQGKATYVNDPFNIDEWISVMLSHKNKNKNDQIDLNRYDVKNIAKKYLIFFQSLNYDCN